MDMLIIFKYILIKCFIRSLILIFLNICLACLTDLKQQIIFNVVHFMILNWCVLILYNMLTQLYDK